MEPPIVIGAALAACGRHGVWRTSDATDRDEFLAKVRRSNAETEKFIEEAYKLRAEEAKLRAEERKLGRDARASPVATVASAMTAGAALFGAGLALARILGH